MYAKQILRLLECHAFKIDLFLSNLWCRGSDKGVSEFCISSLSWMNKYICMDEKETRELCENRIKYVYLYVALWKATGVMQCVYVIK